MIKEVIRVLEDLRRIPDSEWEELMKILKSQTEKEVVSTENPICKNLSTHYEGRVYQLLKELGIPASIKGYSYVRRAILLSIENPEMIDKITRRLYPTIAKEFDTTPSRVERAIRHAIEISFNRGDQDKLHEIFGYSYSSLRGRPTNSEFIAEIVDHILNS